MTEDKWSSCDDWRPLVHFLQGKMTKRKGTLYVCAGLRYLWHLLYDAGSQMAVETAEEVADALASADELSLADWGAEVPTFGFDFDPEFVRQHLHDATSNSGIRRLIELGVYSEPDVYQNRPLGDPATVARLSNAAHIAYHCLYQISEGALDEHLFEHLSFQAEWPGGWLVREVFGNPFVPIALNPKWLSWNGGAVKKLAKIIYDERRFEELPSVADALVHAGCENENVLSHCRVSEPHFRGCWLIDLLLGKQ